MEAAVGQPGLDLEDICQNSVLYIELYVFFRVRILILAFRIKFDLLEATGGSWRPLEAAGGLTGLDLEDILQNSVIYIKLYICYLGTEFNSCIKNKI